MEKYSPIFVTGASGLVGKAIIRKLKSYGFQNIQGITRNECDLSDKLAPTKLQQCFPRPRYIFHAAALVGGIKRNINYPADFGMINSKINNTVIVNGHMHQTQNYYF